MSECSRNRKRLWSTTSAWLVLASWLALAAPQAVEALDYATDPVSGYALGGNDPVAYFIDRKPRRGQQKYELRWGDTVWMFVNEGNRAAFEKAPRIYAPHLKGCDPTALAGGFVTIGNPAIFALHDGHLLLFHSEINRFLFLADPQTLLDTARDAAVRLGCAW